MKGYFLPQKTVHYLYFLYINNTHLIKRLATAGLPSLSIYFLV